jgi:hypothetical protein
MGTLARQRPHGSALEFAVAAAPADVAARFLAQRGVEESSPLGDLAGDPDYTLQRTADGFTLISDPGSWRPGSRAICEAHVAPLDDGARVVVRFRLHPLTRTAFAYIIALGVLMTGFQLIVAGPAIAATVLVPFLIVVGLLAADRNNLRRQQRALRTLVEATLTPITLPHERALPGPFRRGSVP